MADSSLFVAVAGIGGTLLAALIGAYVTLKRTQIQEEHRNKRTIAQHYMGEKIERLLKLSKLNDELAGAFVGFVLDSRRDPNTEIHTDLYENFEHLVHEFYFAFHEAKLFLDEEQTEVVTRCAKTYLAVIRSVETYDDRVRIDWTEVENDNFVVNNDVELDAFRKHARLVHEVIDDELNSPIEEMYESEQEQSIIQGIREF